MLLVSEKKCCGSQRVCIIIVFMIMITKAEMENTGFHEEICTLFYI